MVIAISVGVVLASLLFMRRVARMTRLLVLLALLALAPLLSWLPLCGDGRPCC